MLCDKCNNQMVKNGFRNGNQKYLCKKCGHVYEEIPNKIKRTKKSDRVISLLLHMIENDFNDKINLDEAIEPTEKFDVLVRKIYFDTSLQDNKVIDIQCFNPKLLICADDKYIKFIKIPKHVDEDIDEDNTNDLRRKIIIHDINSLKEMKVIKKNITKYIDE